MYKLMNIKRRDFIDFTTDNFHDIMRHGLRLGEEFVLYYNDEIVGECIGSNLTWVLLNSDFGDIVTKDI